MDDVHLWMIDNHLGLGSSSDFQRGVLALHKKEIVAARVSQAQQSADRADVVGAAERDASIRSASGSRA